MAIRIALLDNYDSFTYNLAYALRHLGAEVDVFLNDAISPSYLAEYDKILLSPGPGLPQDAGIMPELIKAYAGTKPILGICLGHQALAEAFGGKLYNLAHVMHGVASTITYEEIEPIFRNLPEEIEVGRYHSWAVDASSLPIQLTTTATDSDGCIMALRHIHWDIVGLQFHPESVLTPVGNQILQNWLKS
jgi:anthranilate synthase component 2